MNLSLHDFLLKVFVVKKFLKIIPIDFEKSIWNPIWQVKNSAFGFFLAYTIEIAFVYSLPLIFANSLTQGVRFWFWLLIGAIPILFFLQASSYVTSAAIQHNILYSLRHYTQQHFLKVDPLHHTTRSSGEIISKSERLKSSYERMLNTLQFEIFPSAIGLITVLVTILVINFWVGLILFLLIFFLLATNSYFRLVAIKKLQPIFIKKEDKQKSIWVENLSQAWLIRSVFATRQQIQKHKQSSLDTMASSTVKWHAGHFVDLVMILIIRASIVFLLWWAINSVQNGDLNIESATGILVSYTFATARASIIGSRIKRLIEDVHSVKDSYKFIRNFGKITYRI